MLHPWEQFGQMDGVRSRSHARALCRKSFERSAPTGQMSMMLLANGEPSSPSSKKVSITDRLPRWTTHSRSSPATSRMKRVQRVHMMQRSPS